MAIGWSGLWQWTSFRGRGTWRQYVFCQEKFNKSNPLFKTRLKDNLPQCEKYVKRNENIINKIITQAFEGFLSLLVEIDMEKAAVIFDEFRVH